METERFTARPEMTGFRDRALSERHRSWGYHVPAADIDFLLLEYGGNGGGPCALVEYKRDGRMYSRDGTKMLDPLVMRALCALADNSRIPFFVTVYSARLDWFDVYPMNERARDFEEERRLSEAEYVSLLHRLRYRERRKHLPRGVE